VEPCCFSIKFHGRKLGTTTISNPRGGKPAPKLLVEIPKRRNQFKTILQRHMYMFPEDRRGRSRLRCCTEQPIMYKQGPVSILSGRKCDSTICPHDLPLPFASFHRSQSSLYRPISRESVPTASWPYSVRENVGSPARNPL